MSKTREWIQALLLGFVVAFAPVAGCSAPPMNAEQQAEHERLTTERDAAVEALDAAVAQAKTAQAALEQLALDLKVMEEGSSEYAAKLEDLQVTLQAFEAWKGEAEEAAEDAQETEDRIVQLEAKAARGVGEMVVDSVSPLVPGLAAGKPWLIALAPLIFKRPRQHFGKALKDLNPFDGQVAPGAALEGLMKAYGLKHSTEDPEELARLAEKKAQEREAA